MPVPANARNDASQHDHSVFPRRAACETLERRRLLTAGDPDVSFSDDGNMSLNFAGATINIRAVALRLDGKAVLAGTKGDRLAVVRLNVDGSLDTTFGGDGLFESTAMEWANDVAVQDDGKIVVVGIAPRTGAGPDPNRFTTARILADGEGLDSGFDSDGIVSRLYGDEGSLGGYCYANAVAIQNDGKIVVGGMVFIDNIIDFSQDFGITRYNPDGSPDMTFGMRPLDTPVGWNHAAMGGADEILDLAIDYHGDPVSNPRYGSIVAVGDTHAYWHAQWIPSDSKFAVARFRPNGQLDSGLDGDGKLSTSFSGAQTAWASGVIIQPGGKIVVTGSMGPDSGERNQALARYNPNGSLDTSFGPTGSGKVQTDLGGDDIGSGAAPGFVGGFVVAASTGIAAYTFDGLLDTRFSEDGVVGGVNASGQIATTGNTIVPIRALLVAGGTQAHRYIDVGSLVAIGSFDPNATEAGQDPATIIVGRTQRLGTTERVYISVGGTATAPYQLNADYTVMGMTLVHPLTGRSYIDIPPDQTFATATITPTDDARTEGDETIILSISGDQAYDIGAPPSTTLAIRDNDVSGGPVVSSSSFLYNSGPTHRTQFTFNQDVTSSIDASDFEVTGPSGPVPFGFDYHNITNTVTLAFNGILADGDYTARAVASGITNSSGVPMPADSLLKFFVLAGDANRDRAVNIADLGVLATNWQQSPRTFSEGDFNYDGKVDIADLGILATHWQVSLPDNAAMPSSGKSVTGSRRMLDVMAARRTAARLVDQIFLA
jgi:uncharacterized delta-60 repeat protein